MRIINISPETERALEPRLLSIRKIAEHPSRGSTFEGGAEGDGFDAGNNDEPMRLPIGGRDETQVSYSAAHPALPQTHKVKNDPNALLQVVDPYALLEVLEPSALVKVDDLPAKVMHDQGQIVKVDKDYHQGVREEVSENKHHGEGLELSQKEPTVDRQVGRDSFEVRPGKHQKMGQEKGQAVHGNIGQDQKEVWNAEVKISHTECEHPESPPLQNLNITDSSVSHNYTNSTNNRENDIRKGEGLIEDYIEQITPFKSNPSHIKRITSTPQMVATVLDDSSDESPSTSTPKGDSSDSNVTRRTSVQESFLRATSVDINVLRNRFKLPTPIKRRASTPVKMDHAFQDVSESFGISLETNGCKTSASISEREVGDDVEKDELHTENLSLEESGESELPNTDILRTVEPVNGSFGNETNKPEKLRNDTRRHGYIEITRESSQGDSNNEEKLGNNQTADDTIVECLDEANNNITKNEVGSETPQATEISNGLHSAPFTNFEDYDKFSTNNTLSLDRKHFSKNNSLKRQNKSPVMRAINHRNSLTSKSYNFFGASFDSNLDSSDSTDSSDSSEFITDSESAESSDYDGCIFDNDANLWDSHLHIDKLFETTDEISDTLLTHTSKSDTTVALENHILRTTESTDVSSEQFKSKTSPESDYHNLRTNDTNREILAQSEIPNGLQIPQSGTDTICKNEVINGLLQNEIESVAVQKTEICKGLLPESDRPEDQNEIVEVTKSNGSTTLSIDLAKCNIASWDIIDNKLVIKLAHTKNMAGVQTHQDIKRLSRKDAVDESVIEVQNVSETLTDTIPVSSVVTDRIKHLDSPDGHEINDARTVGEPQNLEDNLEAPLNEPVNDKVKHVTVITIPPATPEIHNWESVKLQEISPFYELPKWQNWDTLLEDESEKVCEQMSLSGFNELSVDIPQYNDYQIHGNQGNGLSGLQSLDGLNTSELQLETGLESVESTSEFNDLPDLAVVPPRLELPNDKLTGDSISGVISCDSPSSNLHNNMQKELQPDLQIFIRTPSPIFCISPTSHTSHSPRRSRSPRSPRSPMSPASLNSLSPRSPMSPVSSHSKSRPRQRMRSSASWSDFGNYNNSNKTSATGSYSPAAPNRKKKVSVFRRSSWSNMTAKHRPKRVVASFRRRGRPIQICTPIMIRKNGTAPGYQVLQSTRL